jgi:CRP/FNR family transcriptional regulator
MNATSYPTLSHAVSDPAYPAAHRPGSLQAEWRDSDVPGAWPTRSSLEVGHDRSQPHWRSSLDMIESHVPVTKHRVRANDELYACGQPFEKLHLINSGIFKIVTLAPDGRERSADFSFDGDWLGFDGIPTGQHSCTAVALDIGEVWTVCYSTLMQAAAKAPSLLHHVLSAISAQLARNRDIALSIGTLSADARVADFLLMWAKSLAERGRRTDEINVHMSRADIGAFLGIRLESVSRSLTKLAQAGVIEFNERGRRDISIPDLAALSHFVQSDAESSCRVLQ